MNNNNGQIPPPWGEDMEEAWRAQHKALRARPRMASAWRKRFAVGSVLTIGVLVALILFFCGAFDGRRKG